MMYLILAYFVIGLVLAILLMRQTLPHERWNTPFWPLVFGWPYFVIGATLRWWK